MAKWPWIERKFNFDCPPTKFPDILERFRGTPARLEERVAGLPAAVLTRRVEKGWSIQENVGHLLEAERLPQQRVEEVLAGESVMCAADMTNRRTHEGNYNARHIEVLLNAFRREREKLTARLEQLDESDWGKSAMHPRLQQPMRIVDIALFHSEHDDYHLARIGELIRAFA